MSPRTVLLAALALASCRRAPDSAPALARADAAATRFATTLKGKLQAAMREGGPVRAVAVCTTEARAVAAQVQSESGVRVGRASLRLRNASNAPPPWVGAWLSAQGERRAAGVTGIRAAEGDVARVLRPIVVEPVCVTCHGDPSAMAPTLRDALRAAYPDDHATGYQSGDLRGALWAEVAIAP